MDNRCFICAMLALQYVLSVHGTLSHEYHNYENMTNYLRSISALYPNLTRLYPIGKSVQGRDLWVLALGRDAAFHTLLQPEVKYVANMHGDESVGRELMLQLIDHLVTNYETNTTVSQLLNTTRVHILPSMNPDGFEEALAQSTSTDCNQLPGRNNANDYDLNRNFPDFFRENPQEGAVIQPETQAVMNWLKANQFVLSANIHGGELVVNYPYDNYVPEESIPAANQLPSKYSASPDDDVFVHISKVYSFAHAHLHKGPRCERSERVSDTGGDFPGGITNGAKWYALTGGMQDYNYIYAGCLEVTLELSCCKFPPQDELQGFWLENQNSLIAYLQQAHIGVKGVIQSSTGHPVSGAVVSIIGRDPRRDQSTITTPAGEFWRLLLPGSYHLKIVAADYKQQIEAFEVTPDKVTVLRITLIGDEELEDVNSVESEQVEVTFHEIDVDEADEVEKSNEIDAAVRNVTELLQMSSAGSKLITWDFLGFITVLVFALG